MGEHPAIQAGGSQVQALFSVFSANTKDKYGRVAQLGEHRPYKPGVTGSSPVPPTTSKWIR